VKSLWVSIGLAVGASSAFAAEPAVRVWQEDVVIPTYPLGADDVNPHFFELGGSVIYPYSMQDNLTTEKVDRTYRAWFLENEYLKLMALPEIGGRIQYVYDKRRDEPMFYHNQVLRPGLVALRGAWVSGGIEWNRGPTGHTVTSFSPVDVVGVSNPDGSASLVIGNTEMNFRTGWEVRLTLHPGKTYLDEDIRLYNPTDGFHPYYFWNNTAFPNRPGTRFIYPMSLGSDHDGKEFFSWPTHDGRDLTWLRDYAAPTSVFAYQCEFDFFGAYDVDRDYGIVQVANHHLLPGKKAWTWGQADSGLASQSVLTDEDGPYIEVQSGPLKTQADYAMLAPGQEVRWREFWYPVAGLADGFEFATKDVAVQRRAVEGGVELLVHPSGRFVDAVIRLNGDDVVRTLSPEETTGFRVDADVVDVVILHEGRELLSYRSPLAIPEQTAPEPAPRAKRKRSAEDLYRAGYASELTMHRERARSSFEQALALEPDHFDSLMALASLDMESGRHDAAARHLERAVALRPEEGMAHYLVGANALRRGLTELALASGYHASKRRGFRSQGLALAGRALMRLGRTASARDHFHQAYADEGPDHDRLFDQWLIASLATSNEHEAVVRSREVMARGTTRLAPHVVAALADGHPWSEVRNFVGEDTFAFIELALTFADLGQIEGAVRVLDEAGLERMPIVSYYLAYWTREDRARSEGFLAEARNASHDYLFPSRPETIPVLEYAAAREPGGIAHLALGNVLAGLGRLEEAEEHFRRAVERDATDAMSVAHRNLAMIAWRRDGNPAEAVQSLERAIQARPSDQTLYRDLARLELDRDASDRAVTLLSDMPRSERTRPDVTLLLARALVAGARHDEAIELLRATTFSNREGDGSTWRLFSRAHIERGKKELEEGRRTRAHQDFETALTYPENLNVGRPAVPLEARALFWKGRALQALGRGGEAQAVWRECSSGGPATPEQLRFIAECRSMLTTPP